MAEWLGQLAAMRMVFVALLIAGLAACTAGFASAPANADEIAAMGMGCEQADSFTFIGRTTPAAVGLDDWFIGGPEANRQALIVVTAEPVDANMGMPGMQADLQRWVCIQFDDGSGAAGALPPGWEPPSSTPTASSEGGPSLALLGLVLAGVVLTGVSFLAFRGRA